VPTSRFTGQVGEGVLKYHREPLKERWSSGAAFYLTPGPSSSLRRERSAELTSKPQANAQGRPTSAAAPHGSPQGVYAQGLRDKSILKGLVDVGLANGAIGTNPVLERILS